MLENLLYDADGSFRFRGKKLGECALCGSKDYTYDVGSLAASSRFCRNCINKEGAPNLRKDANVALGRAKRAVDKSTQEMREMDKKFAERFGTNIRWNLPPVVFKR